jgi:hypothetical protein
MGNSGAELQSDSGEYRGVISKFHWEPGAIISFRLNLPVLLGRQELHRHDCATTFALLDQREILAHTDVLNGDTHTRKTFI